jgi:hypothetical protein
MAPSTTCLPSSFVYQKLDPTRKETRLVLIRPGRNEDDVRCEVQTISLLARPLPTYETISYVWGDAKRHGAVHIGNQKLSVPWSTEVVLRRMRRTEIERPVWIDSLCIDQTDDDDRNYQVQLMCDIYSNTVTNLIWLGNDTGEAEEVFQAMRGLYNEARSATRDFDTFKDTVWPGWFEAYGPPSTVEFSAERIAAFFDLPWFSRLWYAVIPETSNGLHPTNVLRWWQ